MDSFHNRLFLLNQSVIPYKILYCSNKKTQHNPALTSSLTTPGPPSSLGRVLRGNPLRDQTLIAVAQHPVAYLYLTFFTYREQGRGLSDRPLHPFGRAVTRYFLFCSVFASGTKTVFSYPLIGSAFREGVGGAFGPKAASHLRYTFVTPSLRLRYASVPSPSRLRFAQFVLPDQLLQLG